MPSVAAIVRTTLRGNTTGQIIHRRVGRSEEKEAANRLV